MQINLLSKNIKLTDDIEDYVRKRVTNLEKLISSMEHDAGEALANFEVAKTTKHQKSEDVFHTDCLIKINGEEFYASADEGDLYTAVDKVKEILFRDIDKNKDRRQTLYRRGAVSVKKMFKGLSKRNPFTSKY
jgi:ribosomal subunit interface protein